MTVEERAGVARAAGSWRRFAASVAALVVVAVGIPAGLVAMAELTLSTWHPLPGIGSWEEIRSWLERELTSSEVAPMLLRVLLVVAWLLWLALLWSVLSSVMMARPSLQRFRLPRLHVFDGIGGWIAAGLTALSSLTPRVATASPAPSSPAIVETVAMPGQVEATPARPLTPRPGWARVQHGESIEEFTARTLGDGTRWPEVWAINRNRAMDEIGTTWSEVWRIDDGWELELPPIQATPANGEPRAALHLVEAAEPPNPQPLAADLGERLTAGSDVTAGQYRVVDGDSYWRIAEFTLPAELGREPTGAEVLARTYELIALNADRLGEPDDPHMLHTGDIVQLPAATAPAASPAPPSQYAVADGDSYWRIAELTLPAELGREPTKAEVLARTYELIALNVDRLGDPDDPHMLHPGDVVQLPVAAAPPPPAPVETTGPPPLAAEPEPARPPPPAPLPVAEPEAVPVAGDDHRAAPAPPAVDPQREPSRTTVTASPVRPERVPAAAEAAGSDGPAPLGLVAGMSAVALAGVAGGWALRRRRAVQRGRPHQRPAPVTPLERAVATHDVSDVTWMARELRLMAHRLPPPTRTALTVQLVQLAGGALEVAFAEIPASPSPAGWRQAAERVWRLEERHSAEALAAVADAPPVLPALVTIGDRSAGQLLLNLEAPPGINVRGDDAMVAAWLASVVWELGGAALSERPAVILVDVDVAGADALPGVVHLSAVEAAAAIDADRADRDGSMLHRRVDEWEAWPPAIVLIATDGLDDQWAERAAAPDVAVVAVGGGLGDGLEVEVVDGTMRIPAWRLEVPATLLEASTVDQAVEVLVAADADPVPDEVKIAAPSAATPLELDVAGDWVPPTFPVTVHLLGEPFASRDGERLALSPQVLSALAYLAVHRDVSVDGFKEAMWGGVEVPRQRLADLLTAVRKAVGGRAVVGHIEAGRIRVGAELGTDLAVFDALNARAQDVPEELAVRLHEIMYLLRGRPFSFPSTSAGMWGWVDHETLEALWGMRVSTVAWELAGLYLERDDPGAARDIAERGLIADPLNAALTERLMEAYAALHAVEAAQRVYEAHDRALTARGFDGAAEETRRVLERLRAAYLGAVDAAVGS